MQRLFRIKRVRAKVSGSESRPRLSASITNRHVIAQVIDDTTGRTLAYSTTLKQDIEGSLLKKAAWAGHDIAKKAQAVKIKQVVFDRRGRRYHGRIKTLAEAARTAGLEF